jgi:endoglucanase
MKNHRLLPCLIVVSAMIYGCAGSSEGLDTIDDTAIADTTTDTTTDIATDIAIVNPLLPPMPLRTSGRWIVDAEGTRVKLSGYNWNRGEGPDFTMSGLQLQDRHVIAAKLHELGFNSIRLVWSNELVETNPVVAADKLTANPDLIGKTALEVMDAVVEALAAEGIMIIMNNHISDAIYCCKSDDDNTLWYNERFPEENWLNDWRTIAARYKNQPAVIGADLRNEPRFVTTWGPDNGDALDWAAAAERGGDAVLEVAPDWLIFVEGVNYSQDIYNARLWPIQLSVPNRLVYEIHGYPWFLNGRTPETMIENWQNNWAFVLEEGLATTAPVWIGEFGLCNSCFNKGDDASLWFDTFMGFIRDQDLDWSWWMLHGDSSPDGWGILNENTSEPVSAELMLIHQGLIAPTQGPGINPAK